MKPIKRAIALCWIMLVACFLIKLFGGNWFEVVCTNEHFIKVCNFIQNNRFVFELFSFALYVFPTLTIIITISLKPIPKRKTIVFVATCLILVWASKFYKMELKTILETVAMFTLPIVVNYIEQENNNFLSVFKKTWFYGLIGSLPTFLFQFISLITKNVGLRIVSRDVLLTFILLVDYYIMIALYYLYIRQWKGDCKNG